MATVPLRRLELATLLSDTAPFLLIAIGLIFAGGNGRRRRFEVGPLLALKTLLFPLVIGYALLGPLVITDALRVYQGADQQGTARLEQAISFRKQVLEAIEPVTTIPQLVTALQKFPVINARINQTDSIDTIKKSLIGTLDRAVTDLQSQQGQQMSGARTGLVGRTVLTVLLTTITATFVNLLRHQVLEQIRASGLAARAYLRADLVEPLASKRAAWASPASAARRRVQASITVWPPLEWSSPGEQASRRQGGGQGTRLLAAAVGRILRPPQALSTPLRGGAHERGSIPRH